MFKTRNEKDRFDHSKCGECGLVFAGVYSFDKHRQAHLITFIREMSPRAATQFHATHARDNFTKVGNLLVANDKLEAYQAMRAKAETARAGRK